MRVDPRAEVGTAAGALPDLRRPAHGADTAARRRTSAGHRERRAAVLKSGASGSRRGASDLRAGSPLLALCLGTALAFLAVPIVALFTEVPLREVPGLLGDPAVRTR